MALISLRDITLAFGGPPLFNGINLQVEEGDRLCLMGSNGSGKENCYDNAPMESFWGSLKNELVHHCRYATREEAKASIQEYIEIFYNRQRRHSRLGYVSPALFTQNYDKMQKVA